jgi:hypothetical protein
MERKWLMSLSGAVFSEDWRDGAEFSEMHDRRHSIEMEPSTGPLANVMAPALDSNARIER